MSNSNNKKTIIESKKQKVLRIFIAVMFFIEVILTTSPFIWGADSAGKEQQLTAFQMAIQPDGYHGVESIKLAIVFAVLLLIPVVGFFFCILDKSRVKNFYTLISSLVCVCIITFGIGPDMAYGAFASLLLYVFILFLNTINLLNSVKENI